MVCERLQKGVVEAKGTVFVDWEGLCGRAIESEKAGRFVRLAELGALAAQ